MTRNIFQSIIDAINFNTATGFDYKFTHSLDKIRDFYIGKRDAFYEQISKVASDHDSLDFYESTIELLEDDDKLSPKMK